MAAARISAALRLYVSAPSDLDLRPLLDGLKRRGAEPYVLSDVAPLGAEILQSLRLAIQSPAIAVRDTKDPGGPALAFTPAGWQAFTRRVRNGAVGR